MNILYHTWEPGLVGNQISSGGGGAWTRFLFQQFAYAGHNVYWFPHTSELDKDWKPPFKIDVAIFCWRWKLPDEPRYEERNRLYRRQYGLINWCYYHSVPFLVHDQDLKMTKEDRWMVEQLDGKIATPSLFPEPGEIMLHYPNPYLLPLQHNSPGTGLVYIGNNYERMDQTVRMLQVPSTYMRTLLYGNWMEPAAGGRMPPEEVEKLLPDVVFPGRLDQDAVIEVLSQAAATVMLHKPEYGPRGFTTIRWAEAVAADVLPFIPSEFRLPERFRRSLAPLVVSNGDELLYNLARIKLDDRERLLDELHKFVIVHMRPDTWLQLLERMVDK